MSSYIIIPGSHPMHRLDIETSISTDWHRFLSTAGHGACNCCARFEPTTIVVQTKISKTSFCRDSFPPRLIEKFLTLGAWSMPCNVDVRWSKCDLKIPLVWTKTIAFTLQTSTRERKRMSDMLCFYIHLVNAVVSVIDVGSSNEVWRYHRSEVW